MDDRRISAQANLVSFMVDAARYDQQRHDRSGAVVRERLQAHMNRAFKSGAFR